MDKKDIYIWSGIVVILVTLTAFLVVNSQAQMKQQLLCQSLRIRPLTDKFFTWSGILELNSKGQYQPKCL
ncbi:MAG: hypothetical protein WC503_01310 [Candidatus Shapirobacteria bacterium]